MIQTIIRGLILLCVIVLVALLVIWVFGQLGIVVPEFIITIGAVILVLLVLLWAWQQFGGNLKL